jgi:hypothetical protein
MADSDVSIDDFKRWKVPELKAFCSERGIASSKKRKEELVALVYAMTIQNTPVLMNKKAEKEAVSQPQLEPCGPTVNHSCCKLVNFFSTNSILLIQITQQCILKVDVLMLKLTMKVYVVRRQA